jgi:hypothetical protein
MNFPSVRRMPLFRESCQQKAWAQKVADKLKIRRFVVNDPEHVSFAGMEHNAVLIPSIEGEINGWVEKVELSPNRVQTFDEVKVEINYWTLIIGSAVQVL